MENPSKNNLYLAAYVLRRSFSGMRRRPWLHVMSTVTLAAAFLSFIATFTAALNLNSVIDRWVGSAEMTVYLRNGTTPEQMVELKTAVAAIDGVASVQPVTASQARASFARDMGALGDVGNTLPEDAFPASMDIHLAPALSKDPATRHALAARLSGVAMIEEVELYDDWFNRLSAVSTMGRTAALGLGILALVVSILVVAATVRQGVTARRREIEVMRFVGATERYVRMPFLIEGAIEATVAMLLALGAMHFLMNQVQQITNDILPLIGGGQLIRLSGGVLLALLAGGLASGLIGAQLSLRRLEEA